MNSAQIDKKGKKKNHRGPSSASAHKAHSSRSNLIGDLLYMYGFWVEYIFVCAYRKAHAVVKGIASTLGNLLMVVLRPVLLGIITFCEDLISPVSATSGNCRRNFPMPAATRSALPKRPTSAAVSASTTRFSGTPSPTCCPPLRRLCWWSSSATAWGFVLC